MSEFKFNNPEIQIVINSSLDKSLNLNKQQMDNMSADIKTLEAYLKDKQLPFAVERKYVYNDKDYLISWEKIGDNPRIFVTDLEDYKNAVLIQGDSKEMLRKSSRPIGELPFADRAYFFRKLPDFLKHIHQTLIKHQELHGL